MKTGHHVRQGALLLGWLALIAPAASAQSSGYGLPGGSTGALPPFNAPPYIPSQSAMPSFGPPSSHRLPTSSPPATRMQTPPPAAAARPGVTHTVHRGPAQVAIVGEVRRPATYVAPRATISLAELIPGAGGFTDRASGTMRVVRHGVTRLQLMYASDTNVLLQSGDVVIVEPAAPRTTSQFGAGSPSCPVAIDGLVHIACVGLADDPVVLPLDPRDAAVPALVANLGQPADAASAVTVIAPHAALPPHQALINGCVCVIDPAKLDPAGLQAALHWAPFPAPVRIEAQAAASATPQSTMPGPSAAVATIPTAFPVAAPLPLPTNNLEATQPDPATVSGTNAAARPLPAAASPTGKDSSALASAADLHRGGDAPTNVAPHLSPEPVQSSPALASSPTLSPGSTPTDPPIAADSEPHEIPQTAAVPLPPLGETVFDPSQFDDPAEAAAAPHGLGLTAMLGSMLAAVGLASFLAWRGRLQSRNASPTAEPRTELPDSPQTSATIAGGDGEQQLEIIPAAAADDSLITGAEPQAASPIHDETTADHSGALNAPGAKSNAEIVTAGLPENTPAERTGAQPHGPVTHDHLPVARVEAIAAAESLRQPETPLESIPASGALAALIGNQLARVEEPLELRSLARFHGTVVGRRRLMLHAPQGLEGPHFSTAMRKEEPVAAPVAVTESPAVVHEQYRPELRRRPARPIPPAAAAPWTAPPDMADDVVLPERRPLPTYSGGLLERVLVSVNRESRE